MELAELIAIPRPAFAESVSLRAVQKPDAVVLGDDGADASVIGLLQRHNHFEISIPQAHEPGARSEPENPFGVLSQAAAIRRSEGGIGCFIEHPELSAIESGEPLHGADPEVAIPGSEQALHGVLRRPCEVFQDWMRYSLRGPVSRT